jgi:hypothetical protein
MLKNILGKMAIGRKLLKSETGDKVLKGLSNYYGYKIDKKVLSSYLVALIVVLLGVALLSGVITFEEFKDGVDSVK